MSFPLWLKTVILGIVEGLTEFLPVSSTGHLMVAGHLLGFDSEVFEMFIQMGALLAVWWLFRDKLMDMLPWKWRTNPAGGKLAMHVCIGFMPILILGYLTKHWHRNSIPVIAWATLVGGIVILLVEYFKPRVIVDRIASMTPVMALVIGLGQCLALCPGVSRSGATIVVGLIVGLSRSVAAEFTFLLAIPTMSAVTFYELWKSRHDLSSDMLFQLGLGFVVAYVTAFLVVKWFVRFIQTHSFIGFAWYRIGAGLLLLGLISKGVFKI